jgi:hypothetical protein
MGGETSVGTNLLLFALVFFPSVFVGALLARPLASALYRLRHGRKMPY